MILGNRSGQHVTLCKYMYDCGTREKSVGSLFTRWNVMAGRPVRLRASMSEVIHEPFEETVPSRLISRSAGNTSLAITSFSALDTLGSVAFLLER